MSLLNREAVHDLLVAKVVASGTDLYRHLFTGDEASAMLMAHTFTRLRSLAMDGAVPMFSGLALDRWLFPRGRRQRIATLLVADLLNHGEKSTQTAGLPISAKYGFGAGAVGESRGPQSGHCPSRW
jgi:hypothetical protein